MPELKNANLLLIIMKPTQRTRESQGSRDRTQMKDRNIFRDRIPQGPQIQSLTGLAAVLERPNEPYSMSIESGFRSFR